jgi:hypothetical protein
VTDPDRYIAIGFDPAGPPEHYIVVEQTLNFDGTRIINRIQELPDGATRSVRWRSRWRPIGIDEGPGATLADLGIDLDDDAAG